MCLPEHSASWPHRELHLRPQWQCPHASTDHSASWPHREFHLRPQWRCPKASPPSSTGLRGPMRE
eukprot:7746552-Pyramimonas_sp.AAC.1